MVKFLVGGNNKDHYKIAAAAIEQGHTVEFTTPFKDYECDPLTVVMNSIYMVRSCVHGPILGKWFDDVQLSAVYQYAYWSEFLYNTRVRFLPLGTALAYWKNLDPHVRKFVRPNSGAKLFPGGVYTLAELKDQIINVDKHSLIMIADCNDTWREYRSFIVDRKVVTTSLYMVEGKLTCKNQDDRNWKFQEILDQLPDLDMFPSCFVMDTAISKYEKDLKVLEINSINCAGLYACDERKIVKALAEEVLKYVDEDSRRD